MRERFTPILKLICLALAALMISQLSRLALRKDPLASLSFVTISLSNAAPEMPSAPRQTSSAKGTNSISAGAGLSSGSTNAPTGGPGARTALSASPSDKPEIPERSGVSALPRESALTSGRWTNSDRAVPSGLAAPGDGRTPGARQARLSGRVAGLKGPELPADIQTRVDRITQSEILGMVMRPLPMALLGIAGPDALLRAPDGQTGLLREGEELGGIKLLRIGTNRVLIEHEQQKKELTLFSGFGSETLLPNGKANTQ